MAIDSKKFKTRLRRSIGGLYGTKLCGLVDDAVSKYEMLQAKYHDDLAELIEIINVLRYYKFCFWEESLPNIAKLPEQTPFSIILGEPMKIVFNYEENKQMSLYIGNKYGLFCFGNCNSSSIRMTLFRNENEAHPFVKRILWDISELYSTDEFSSSYYHEVAIRLTLKALYVFEREFPAFRDKYIAQAESFIKP